MFEKPFESTNFIRLKNLINLNLPLFIGNGALVGICLMGNVMMSKSATARRHDYEQRIKELDRHKRLHKDIY